MAFFKQLSGGERGVVATGPLRLVIYRGKKDVKERRFLTKNGIAL